jgi:hypothetical protein
MAATTLSKFSSGSPMPMNTTLVMGFSRSGCGGSSRLAVHIGPRISPTPRGRLKPWRAVWQKLQFS